MDVQVQSAVTGAAKQVASERRRVMSQKLAVVITGGTGKQGGAVVKSLLERGHEVRAVTRSTDSAKARELTPQASSRPLQFPRSLGWLKGLRARDNPNGHVAQPAECPLLRVKRSQRTFALKSN